MRCSLGLLLLIAACQAGVPNRSGPPVGGPTASAQISVAPPVAPATTIRNVTQEAIEYGVQAVGAGSGEPLQQGTLAPGGVARLEVDQALVLTYRSGDRVGQFRLEPHKPYSLRYDDDGQVSIYPGSHGHADAADLGPFVPTPMEVVDEMLALAGPGAGDLVYDIGCGDGRIVIRAAKRFGCRGVGIDVVPELIARAREAAREQGVADRVEFRVEDATKSRFADATIVLLYLLPESNVTLRPAFEQQLRPGTMVVTHDYGVPGWEDRLQLLRRIRDTAGKVHAVYVYRR